MNITKQSISLHCDTVSFSIRINHCHQITHIHKFPLQYLPPSSHRHTLHPHLLTSSHTNCRPTLHGRKTMAQPNYFPRARGTWYLPNQHQQHLSQPLRNRDVRVQADSYMPYQSMFDTSGKYGYPSRTTNDKRIRTQGVFPQNVRALPQIGGPMRNAQWEHRRPNRAPRYDTRPLGVRGLTDRSDYDWSWFNNYQNPRTGRQGYRPPDREVRTPLPNIPRRRRNSW